MTPNAMAIQDGIKRALKRASKALYTTAIARDVVIRALLQTQRLLSAYSIEKLILRSLKDLVKENRPFKMAYNR